jgi:glycosyltransferase involved in cell wall biosynthesis
MKNNRPFKLAYFVSHPIQYQAPLLKKISEHPEVDLNVFFLSDISTHLFYDTGFNSAIKWDTPLLEGYKSKFIQSYQYSRNRGFWNPFVFGVRQILRSTQWDAVWFHGYAHYALVWGIFNAIRLHIPLFFRAESTMTCSPHGILKSHYIKWLIRNTSKLLWVSSDNRVYYEHYGANESQFVFMPYAVDNSLFQEKINNAQSAQQKLRTQLGLTNDWPIVLYVGKFIKRKNPVLLFDAFASISPCGKTAPQAYLIYVGEGEERGVLEARIANVGWQSQVKLTGFINQTELPAYYALCDLFVIPSNQEPFGLVINEAMNAGKAIISTNEVGASRDLVQEGRNGYVVQAGDVNALANKLKIVLADRKKLLVMGQESLKIINEWSFEQDINGIVQALHKIKKNHA